MARIEDTSLRANLPAVLGGVGLVAVAFAVLVEARAGWPEWTMLLGSGLTAVSWLLPGWLIAQRRPDLPFGWLLLAGGLFLAVGAGATSYGTAAAVQGWAGAAWAGWFGGWIFFPHLGCQEATYVLFPSGRPPSARWGKVLVAIVVVNVLMMVAAAFGGGDLAGSGVLSLLASPVGEVAVLGGLFPLLAASQNVLNLLGMSVVFRRWRQAPAPSPERRVLGVLFLLGAVDALVGLLLIAPIGDWIFIVAVPSTMGLTLSVAWGVLRHRLWDVRLIVRRTVTWLLLTGVLIAILTTGVAVLGRTVGLVAAAALVTVVVAPLERRLRRLVDHMVFGERSEPYTVLSTLGADLEAAGGPVEALERLVSTIRASLKVAYAAVELADQTVAAAGEPPADLLRLPVRHHGQETGALLVGQHPGDRPFTASDRRLLDDLARQAGAAAASVALTTALQQSRHRLVSAREEERRRLRSELHDGVASALTAIGLKVESAASIAVTDGARTEGILQAVQDDVSTTLREVRRVVTDLRPPALEDLGLVGALGQLASRFDTPGLRVEFTGATAALPAAVELALYRIANEALQNVVRHAQASSCRLTLTTDGGGVVLTVEDDGNGLINASRNGGLGLPGMVERADELGGTVTVGPRQDGQSGSVVKAFLPT